MVACCIVVFLCSVLNALARIKARQAERSGSKNNITPSGTLGWPSNLRRACFDSQVTFLLNAGRQRKGPANVR